MSATARIEDLDDSTFDPYKLFDTMRAHRSSAYPILDELRKQGSVLAVSAREVLDIRPSPELDAPGGHYMVLSFSGVRQVLGDPITYSNRSFEPTLGRSFGQTLSVMDPPVHSRYRRILQRVFQPSIVSHWADDIVAPVIDELMSQICGLGGCELVEQFLLPYPFNVIYRILGLPDEDIEVFYKLTIAQIVNYPNMDNALDASAKLGRYFSRMLADRRDNPGSDLPSIIAAATVDGESLPEEVSIAFLRQLINAGGDTTFRTSVALLTGLLTNPDQLNAVRADRSLARAAVEEALRWDGAVPNAQRWTTADSVIDGVRVPAHSLVDIMLGAANHDPVEFDHPEKFDIFREGHRHFGFAFGAHNCLGQQLARLEMTRALNAVLDRLPQIKLDPEYPVRVVGGIGQTAKEIHVRYD